MLLIKLFSLIFFSPIAFSEKRFRVYFWLWFTLRIIIQICWLNLQLFGNFFVRKFSQSNGSIFSTPSTTIEIRYKRFHRINIRVNHVYTHSAYDDESPHVIWNVNVILRTYRTVDYVKYERFRQPDHLHERFCLKTVSILSRNGQEGLNLDAAVMLCERMVASAHVSKLKESIK